MNDIWDAAMVKMETICDYYLTVRVLIRIDTMKWFQRLLFIRIQTISSQQNLSPSLIMLARLPHC